jgi:hypothetical protein
MISRRDFLQTAAVGTMATPLAEMAKASDDGVANGERRRPLRAEPKHRIIRARSGSRGGLRLFSDGPQEPRPLIRTEVLEATFGKGVGQSLSQPDHWRMIDEGWFACDDLFEVTDLASWDYAVWQANYHPECEAHDLLFEFFGAGLWPGGGINEDLGLVFAEHPCTPRFATLDLIDGDRLPDLASRLADVTEWITIETS